ncbi:PssD/Cps14F family polysaccharide biosynthesis glycosyltransferase [Shouchella hunanensis]|uniref:Polysaccharide biosynthesis protein n=1 Tax=Shouchella hunanensis TaxID=766894 RepID=A0ABY7W7H0_9BACI|nr:PssD/Cps14F family polysaccharide biosynthesis glycosyltransferase [Shouchella hunanensis]WDF04897.1 polysaccharide biosynthesis protein [Shouchella hunanensis]
MKITLISSTGGHWAQLLQLQKVISEEKHVELNLITEKNRTNSSMDCSFLLQQDRKNIFFTFIFLINIIKSLYFVITVRPKYVISTGAGSVIPYLFFAKLFGSKVIYIESFAKVNSPTITGRIVYKFADHFFVQWENMLKFYPNALYKGSLY